MAPCRPKSKGAKGPRRHVVSGPSAISLAIPGLNLINPPSSNTTPSASTNTTTPTPPSGAPSSAPPSSSLPAPSGPRPTTSSSAISFSRGAPSQSLAPAVSSGRVVGQPIYAATALPSAFRPRSSPTAPSSFARPATPSFTFSAPPPSRPAPSSARPATASFTFSAPPPSPPAPSPSRDIEICDAPSSNFSFVCGDLPDAEPTAAAASTHQDVKDVELPDAQQDPVTDAGDLPDADLPDLPETPVSVDVGTLPDVSPVGIPLPPSPPPVLPSPTIFPPALQTPVLLEKDFANSHQRSPKSWSTCSFSSPPPPPSRTSPTRMSHYEPAPSSPSQSAASSEVPTGSPGDNPPSASGKKRRGKSGGAKVRAQKEKVRVREALAEERRQAFQKELEEKEEQKEKMAALEAEVARLTEELDRAREDAEDAARFRTEKARSSEQAFSNLEASLAEEKKLVEDAVRGRDLAQGEVAKLTKQLREAVDSDESTKSELAKTMAELGNVQGKVKAKDAEIASQVAMLDKMASKHAEELAAMRTKTDLSQSTTTEARRQLQEAHSLLTNTEELVQQEASMRAAAEQNLQELMTETERQQQAAEDDRAAMAAQINELVCKRSNAATDERLRTAEATTKDVEAKLATVVAQFESQRTANKLLNEELSALQKDNLHLRGELDDLTKKFGELDDLTKKFGELKVSTMIKPTSAAPSVACHRRNTVIPTQGRADSPAGLFPTPASTAATPAAAILSRAPIPTPSTPGYSGVLNPPSTAAPAESSSAKPAAASIGVILDLDPESPLLSPTTQAFLDHKRAELSPVSSIDDLTELERSKASAATASFTASPSTQERVDDIIADIMNFSDGFNARLDAIENGIKALDDPSASELRASGPFSNEPPATTASGSTPSESAPPTTAQSTNEPLSSCTGMMPYQPPAKPSPPATIGSSITTIGRRFANGFTNQPKSSLLMTLLFFIMAFKMSYAEAKEETAWHEANSIELGDDLFLLTAFASLFSEFVMLWSCNLRWWWS